MITIPRLFLRVGLVLLVLAGSASADYLVISRSATIRSGASSSSSILRHVEPNDVLVLASSSLTNRWYKVRRPDATGTGWVYQTMWQYTSSGPIVGDHDKFNGALDRVVALANG